jgi:hypothetical protein
MFGFRPGPAMVTATAFPGVSSWTNAQLSPIKDASVPAASASLNLPRTSVPESASPIPARGRARGLHCFIGRCCRRQERNGNLRISFPISPPIR